MCRVASVLLAALLTASRASAAPPPDQVMQDPMRFLQEAEGIILVRVVESKPGETPEHTTATLQVIKEWKGPYAAGRILHVHFETPLVVSCAGPCKSPYVFQPDDKELLIRLSSGTDQDPIAVWQGWVWSAAESKALMEALDQAVCPSCAKPPMPSR